MRKTITVTFLFAMTATAWAADGGQPAAFALAVGDGRAQAMGGAGVTLGGVGAGLYNPAAWVTVERNELASTWREMSLERRLVSAGFGRRILADSGVGLNWVNASVADVVSRSEYGVPGPLVKNSQNLFAFGC